MSPWIVKLIVSLASIALVVIRAPHGHRSRSVPIVKDSRGRLEKWLLSLAVLGFLVPLIWIATPALAFAEYVASPWFLGAGVVAYVVGLWLFHRSHVDLGTNWSITLQVREHHQLVTRGVYRRIRHPMYLALFLYSLGQWFALPNWVAGPSYLVTFGLLFMLRIRAEERLMIDTFGDAYREYRRTTWGLLPGIW